MEKQLEHKYRKHHNDTLHNSIKNVDSKEASSDISIIIFIEL